MTDLRAAMERKTERYTARGPWLDKGTLLNKYGRAWLEGAEWMAGEIIKRAREKGVSTLRQADELPSSCASVKQAMAEDAALHKFANSLEGELKP